MQDTSPDKPEANKTDSVNLEFSTSSDHDRGLLVDNSPPENPTSVDMSAVSVSDYFAKGQNNPAKTKFRVNAYVFVFYWQLYSDHWDVYYLYMLYSLARDAKSSFGGESIWKAYVQPAQTSTKEAHF